MSEWAHGQGCRVQGADAARALPYAGAMSTPAEEHVALVALLRTLDKGKRWGSVTERVLECRSAVAIWDEKVGESLLRDPELTNAYDQAAADVRAWAEAGYQMV